MFNIQSIEKEFSILRDKAIVRVSEGSPEKESELGHSLIRKLIQSQTTSADESYTELSFPNPQYSLSHCSGVCLAVFSSEANGIGVDIEKVRPIDLRVVQFFLSSRERLKYGLLLKESLRVQTMWAIKEAIFKADINNEGRAYRNYEIIESCDDFKLGRAKSKYDGVEYKFETKCWKDFIIAVACRMGRVDGFF